MDPFELSTLEPVDQVQDLNPFEEAGFASPEAMTVPIWEFSPVALGEGSTEPSDPPLDTPHERTTREVLDAEFQRRCRALPASQQNDPSILAQLSEQVYYDEATYILQENLEREGARVFLQAPRIHRQVMRLVVPRACGHRGTTRASRPVRRRRSSRSRTPTSGDSDPPEPSALVRMAAA
jgi:hypothetical protein